MSESQRTIEEIRESIGEQIAINARLVAEIQALKEELEFAQTEARRWHSAYAEARSEAGWIVENQRY